MSRQMLSTLPHRSSRRCMKKRRREKGKRSKMFMFQEMPCLNIWMERYRAIKYIKTTRSAETLFCFPFCSGFFVFTGSQRVKERRRRKLSNFPRPPTLVLVPFSFQTLFFSFYRWEILALLLFLSFEGSDEQARQP